MSIKQLQDVNTYHQNLDLRCDSIRCKDATVDDSMTITNNLTVDGNLITDGNLTVNGSSSLDEVSANTVYTEAVSTRNTNIGIATVNQTGTFDSPVTINAQAGIITTVLASTLGGGGLPANSNVTIVVSNNNCIGSDLIFTTVLFSSGAINKQVSVHVNAITALGFEIVFMNGGNALITESFKIGFWLVHSYA